jgi:RHS repeat-associated protein
MVWDMSENLPLLLYDGTNSYIYGPEGRPFEQINAEEEASYLHHDQQGSTRLITNASGEAKGTYTYTPYGAVEGHTGSATTPLGYNGQYTSEDTGLVYLRARVYDPTTAQFLTVDPRVTDTGDPYGYAQSNPVNFSDPSGEVAIGLVSTPVLMGWVPAPVVTGWLTVPAVVGWVTTPVVTAWLTVPTPFGLVTTPVINWMTTPVMGWVTVPVFGRVMQPIIGWWTRPVLLLPPLPDDRPRGPALIVFDEFGDIMPCQRPGG